MLEPDTPKMSRTPHRASCSTTAVPTSTAATIPVGVPGSLPANRAPYDAPTPPTARYGAIGVSDGAATDVQDDRGRPLECQADNQED